MKGKSLRICKRLLRGPRAWYIQHRILRNGGSMPVHSAALASLDYNPTTQVLNIAFNHGGIYAFREVPKEEVKGLLTAESRGRYFVHKIRGRYETEKLSPKASPGGSNH